MTHNFFYRFKKRLRRFLNQLDERETKVLRIVAASFVVLVLGGIILFFTKDNGVGEKDSMIKITCKDTDGSNIHNKGAVTYTDEKGAHVDEDSCDLAEKSVYEMTCHKDSFWSVPSRPQKISMPCEKICINGACIK